HRKKTHRDVEGKASEFAWGPKQYQGCPLDQGINDSLTATGSADLSNSFAGDNNEQEGRDNTRESPPIESRSSEAGFTLCRGRYQFRSHRPNPGMASARSSRVMSHTITPTSRR